MWWVGRDGVKCGGGVCRDQRMHTFKHMHTHCQAHIFYPRFPHTQQSQLSPPHPAPPTDLHPTPHQVYELPTYLAYPLFYKLVQPGESVVRPRVLLDWCDAHNLMGVTEVHRMFEILRGDDRRPFLVQEDFSSMMNGILLNHPGLEFLQETPEFQERCVGVCYRDVLGVAMCWGCVCVGWGGGRGGAGLIATSGLPMLQPSPPPLATLNYPPTATTIAPLHS